MIISCRNWLWLHKLMSRCQERGEAGGVHQGQALQASQEAQAPATSPDSNWVSDLEG